jgi:hypothetical protein
VAASQIWIAASSEDASLVPSGFHATMHFPRACSLRVTVSSRATAPPRAARFVTLTVPSLPAAEARRLPSGLHDTAFTGTAADPITGNARQPVRRERGK